MTEVEVAIEEAMARLYLPPRPRPYVGALAPQCAAPPGRHVEDVEDWGSAGLLATGIGSVLMFISPESFVLAEAGNLAWERRAPRPEDDHLLAHTQNWLRALPKGVRPIHLQAKFPRIANDLSRLWPETAALDQYFEEKEFSPRTDRRGFPPLVKEELLCMHVYSLRNRSTPDEQRSPARASLLA